MSKAKTLKKKVDKKVAKKTPEKDKLKAPKAKEAILKVETKHFSKYINPNKKRGKMILAVLADLPKIKKAGNKGIKYDIPKVLAGSGDYMDKRITTIIASHVLESEKVKLSFKDLKDKDVGLKSKLGLIGFTAFVA